MSELKYTEINSCRVCESTDLCHSIELGILASCGVFQAKSKLSAPTGVLSLLICRRCLLVQTDRNFDLDELFRIEYGYESSLNSSMALHLFQMINEYKNSGFSIEKNNYLDIGSNDGTLINFVAEEEIFANCYAVDPTIEKFSSNYSFRVKQNPDFFNLKTAQKLSEEGIKFDLITSIAMFYDLPEPDDFVKGIKSLLAQNGVWILELSYLYSMVKSLAFDTICHEHLEYYSLYSLRHLIQSNNMKIVKFDENDSNGGSMRLYIAHNESTFQEANIETVLANEFSNAEEIDRMLQKMMQDVAVNITLAKEFLNYSRSNNLIVHGLGASTKGNTFLQYAGLTSDDIQYVAEINEKKFGKITPGSQITIISEMDSEKMNPAFYIVLPWHFRKNIIEKKRKFLEDGGRLIFVFPQFEIVEKA